MPPRHLLLAAALSGSDPSRLTERARAAEAAGLDLVTVEPGPLDPLLAAARLAAQTSRVGIVPVVPTTTTEPFHVSTALATVDVVSGGRAGWLAEVLTPAAARGTVTWSVPDDVLGDAREHVEAVRALWDSWEDGAIIRDAASARFLDRARVHHVDLRGTHLAVRGPSITPRPPQGHPVVAVRDPALAAAADVLVTADADAAATPGPLRLLELPAATAEQVLAARDAGFDGVLVHGGEPAALVPALRDLGVLPPVPATGTLRERLGLPVAPNRYAP